MDNPTPVTLRIQGLLIGREEKERAPLNDRVTLLENLILDLMDILARNGIHFEDAEGEVMGGWGEDKGPTPEELHQRELNRLGEILSEKVKKHEENPSTRNQETMHKAADKYIDYLLKRPQ